MRLASGLVAIASIVGCIVTPPPSTASPDPATIEIWTAAFDEYFGRSRPTDELALSPAIGGLGDSRSPSDTSIQSWLVQDRIPADIYWAYIRANGPTTTLTRAPRIPGYRFRLMRPNDQWTPGEPIYDLMLPGVNAAGDSAIVMVGQSCGPLCGRSVFLVMARDSLGRWVTVRRQDLLS